MTERRRDTVKPMVQDLLQVLTLEEKASLCSGRDFWNLKGIPEKGVPSVLVTDGPHGLRKQAGDADHPGLNTSVPATCFPTAAGLAATWNEALVEQIGQALGRESRHHKVAVILGPGANIKRSPLCGRNFEYFSEDPFLTGRMAAAHIRGVQSQGVGTSLKHFAVNNQERRRMTIDAIVDERAMREVYLSGFEYAVKDAQPATVMCAYNRLNGTYCSEHRELLQNILKDEWAFDGLVVTDWGAANDRVEGLKAGLDLEMPGNRGVTDALIVAAVRNGQLDEQVVNEAVSRILSVILPAAATLEDAVDCDYNEHHALARKAAAQSVVLLKNENDTLPVSDTRQSIAVIGAFAKDPRYQGAGSSLINPTRVDTAWDAIQEYVSVSRLRYAPGYEISGERRSQKLIDEACAVARETDCVLLFAGLPDSFESEGFDRAHLDLPESHTALIRAVAAVNSNTTVILSNGAPVVMPWLSDVPAVLESYLGGQACGGGIADVLFGAVNPSGRLAETFPAALDDVSSSPNFPGGTAAVVYAESVYVGYRYHTTGGPEPLFPFGYGLSYTRFAYRDLSIVRQNDDTYEITCVVTNTGEVAGAEVVQLYVRDVESSVFRPDRELKGFARIKLKPGKSGTVRLKLDRRAFSFWDTGSERWTLEAGTFEILVGASSADIRLNGTVDITTGDAVSGWAREQKERVPGYFRPTPALFSGTGIGSEFEKVLGRPVPAVNRVGRRHFTRTSTLEDIRSTWFGSYLRRSFLRKVRDSAAPDADERNVRMMQAVVNEMPLRNLGMMSDGKVPPETVDGIVDILNGRIFRGVRRIRSTRR